MALLAVRADDPNRPQKEYYRRNRKQICWEQRIKRAQQWLWNDDQLLDLEADEWLREHGE